MPSCSPRKPRWCLKASARPSRNSKPRSQACERARRPRARARHAACHPGDELHRVSGDGRHCRAGGHHRGDAELAARAGRARADHRGLHAGRARLRGAVPQLRPKSLRGHRPASSASSPSARRPTGRKLRGRCSPPAPIGPAVSARSRRHRLSDLHQRHDRQAEGRRAQPPRHPVVRHHEFLGHRRLDLRPHADRDAAVPHRRKDLPARVSRAGRDHLPASRLRRQPRCFGSIEDERITTAHFAPSWCATCSTCRILPTIDKDSLRAIIYASAPMAVAQLREAIAAFGLIFNQVYGMTECVVGTILHAHQHLPDGTPAEVRTACLRRTAVLRPRDQGGPGRRLANAPPARSARS